MAHREHIRYIYFYIWGGNSKNRYTRISTGSHSRRSEGRPADKEGGGQAVQQQEVGSQNRCYRPPAPAPGRPSALPRGLNFAQLSRLKQSHGAPCSDCSGASANGSLLWKGEFENFFTEGASVPIFGRMGVLGGPYTAPFEVCGGPVLLFMSFTYPS